MACPLRLRVIEHSRGAPGATLFQENGDGGASRTADVQGSALLRLAHSTIGLSQVAPRLNEMAAARQDEAHRQAHRAKDVASLARRMSDSLGESVDSLRIAAHEIAELTGLIRRVADQTSLIAINTGIAAARAGADGDVFAVLAQEIRMLSQNTAQAAAEVEGKVRRLRESADRTAGFVGRGTRRTTDGDAGPGLAWLLERMVEAEESAGRQAEEAQRLTAVGAELRELSERMIRCVGAFRLDAHQRAEATLERLRVDAELAMLEPAAALRTLRAAIEACPFIEMAYATDARGVQFTENVVRDRFVARYGSSGLGIDWSRRPWFVGARGTRGVFTSEIYRSEATGEFCLTVAATFGPDRAPPRGVVALDVNFRELLGGARG